MRFRVEQRYDGVDPAALARAYADPALYASFGHLPRTGQPEVLAHDVDGDIVELQVRWRFAAPLSGAARAVVDPDRLTWVDESRHDLTACTTTFRMVPDHYRDRLSCGGAYRFAPGALRTVEGDLKVRAPLVARTVERAIVSGLEEQLRSEVGPVRAFLGLT